MLVEFISEQPENYEKYKQALIDRVQVEIQFFSEADSASQSESSGNSQSSKGSVLLVGDGKKIKSLRMTPSEVQQHEHECILLHFAVQKGQSHFFSSENNAQVRRFFFVSLCKICRVPIDASSMINLSDLNEGMESPQSPNDGTNEQQSEEEKKSESIRIQNRDGDQLKTYDQMIRDENAAAQADAHAALVE